MYICTVFPSKINFEYMYKTYIKRIKNITLIRILMEKKNKIKTHRGADIICKEKK